MIATMSTCKLLDKASELGEAILQSEVFLHYIIAKKELSTDRRAQARIRRFTELKDQYEEVQRFGRYHPDHAEVSSAIRKIKREVDLTDSVIAFKQAENELESL